jgi:hypothetical protein
MFYAIALARHLTTSARANWHCVPILIHLFLSRFQAMASLSILQHARPRFFLEDDAAQISNPIGRAMDKEAVQMFAAPIEGTLKNFVEFGDAGVACHEQTPPYQRTHAARNDAERLKRWLHDGRERSSRWRAASEPAASVAPRGRFVRKPFYSVLSAK